ncbi:rod shape-determining protein MreC [Rhodohalobacter sp.]|uniref:rod shape-determining protein MreC n=1 Tax=Rhodohalobacter sp. TaxID=1974210 RepID=UPI002ACD4220|nr:rod shape-determining protein MreC [Rhodohalobacter sp.]MDZ7756682.1 rod shape-determining protein MreC [Rhodohalobacter sp.]
MRRLADAKDYIITALILLIATALMVSRHDGGLQNVRKISVTVLSYLEQPLSNIRIYRQALTTNTYLQRQNILLQDELSRLRSADQQNQILRELLNLREESEHSLIPVQIVAKDLRGLNNSLTVSAGTDDGIRQGMPLMNSDGLVGQVNFTAKNYAQVLPYSNSLFRVSARIQSSRAYGIVSWDGDSENELTLQYVPQTIPVDVGQIVETSGASNQFPAGIPIGEITAVEPGRGVETQTIYLRAFADLFTLSEAFVVAFEPDTTINQLINQQEELF